MRTRILFSNAVVHQFVVWGYDLLPYKPPYASTKFAAWGQVNAEDPAMVMLLANDATTWLWRVHRRYKQDNFVVQGDSSGKCSGGGGGGDGGRRSDSDSSGAAVVAAAVVAACDHLFGEGRQNRFMLRQHPIHVQKQYQPAKYDPLLVPVCCSQSCPSWSLPQAHLLRC